MEKATARLGYWSSVASAVTFIVFTVCFIAIFLTSPVYTWKGIEDYTVYISRNSQLFKYIAQFMMLVFGVSYIVLCTAIVHYSEDDRKPFAKLALYFAIIFTTLISSHYFVQLSSVRLAFEKGTHTGYEHFIQANPYSVMSAVNMLGWCLFLGLSSMFAAPVFSVKGRLEKVTRLFFILNGIFCILGGIGYIFEIMPLVFFCINLGMGGSVLVFSISLAVLFRRSYRILSSGALSDKL